MPEANGMILSKEEENDNEVRREDQDAINEFGRLNARLDEVKKQVDNLKVRHSLLHTNSLAACIEPIVLLDIIFELENTGENR